MLDAILSFNWSMIAFVIVSSCSGLSDASSSKGVLRNDDSVTQARRVGVNW